MSMFVLWLTQYGYFALFTLLFLGILGIPLPDEFLLMSAGYLCSQGKLHLPLIIIAGTMGSICGISGSYLIGRFIGLPALHKFGRWLHITDKNIQTVHNWFERYGKWPLTFGYFIPGFRHLTAILSGATAIPWHLFSLYAYLGALIWSSTFILLGYFLGAQAMKLGMVIHHYFKLASIIVLSALAVSFAVWWYFSGKKMPPQKTETPPTGKADGV